MTFLAHGFVGAASADLLRSWGGRSRSWIWVVSGWILGTLPDSLDWILAVLGIFPRWYLYGLFHHDWLGWATAWISPIGLHMALDLIVHRGPSGTNWWPEFWWAEALAWILPLSWLLWEHRATIASWWRWIRGIPQRIVAVFHFLRKAVNLD